MTCAYFNGIVASPRPNDGCLPTSCVGPPRAGLLRPLRTNAEWGIEFIDSAFCIPKPFPALAFYRFLSVIPTPAPSMSTNDVSRSGLVVMAST